MISIEADAENWEKPSCNVVEDFKKYIEELEQQQFLMILTTTPIALQKIHQGMNLIFYEFLNYFAQAHKQILRHFVAHTRTLLTSDFFTLNGEYLTTVLDYLYKDLGHKDLAHTPGSFNLLTFMNDHYANATYQLSESQQKFLETIKNHKKMNTETYKHVAELYKLLQWAQYLEKLAGLIEIRFQKCLHNELLLMGVFDFERIANLAESFVVAYEKLLNPTNVPKLKDNDLAKKLAQSDEKKGVELREVGKKLVQQLRSTRFEPLPLNTSMFSEAGTSMNANPQLLGVFEQINKAISALENNQI